MSDKMPSRLSVEFNIYADRLMKLPANDFYDLFEIVDIRFPNTSRQDLVATPKEQLVGIFDEADSCAKVEKFLEEHGL